MNWFLRLTGERADSVNMGRVVKTLELDDGQVILTFDSGLEMQVGGKHARRVKAWLEENGALPVLR